MLTNGMMRILFPALCALLLIGLTANTVAIVKAQAEHQDSNSEFQSLVLSFQSDALEHLVALVDLYSSEPTADSKTAVQQALVRFISELDGAEYRVPFNEGQLSKLYQRRLNTVRDVISRIGVDLDTRDLASWAVGLVSELQNLCQSLEHLEQFVMRESSQLISQNQAQLYAKAVVQAGLMLCLGGAVALWLRQLHRQNRSLALAKTSEAERADLATHQFDHDEETGLVNFRAFKERVWNAYRRQDRAQGLTIFCLNLTRPSRNTDKPCSYLEGAFMASAGIALHQLIDQHMKSAVLGRGPGMSFYIMTAGQGDDITTNEVADRILELFKLPIRTNAGSCSVAVSVGIAEVLPGDRSPDPAVENAELAAQTGQSKDIQGPTLFQSSMRADAGRRSAIEAALLKAIDANDFLPHFQPQFDLKSGEIYGVEALARWYEPELGWISPSEFIPIAENSGQIVRLGWKILETSCAQIQLLPGNLTLSVNLSVIQMLNDDVVGMVKDCLAKTGLPAQRLKLEISESTVRHDLNRIQKTLSDLQSIGVQISLDDFGVGYSALSYLADIEWDEIKIDSTFSIKAVQSKKQSDILKMVLEFAKTAGTHVLIEGIETIDQCDALINLGCSRGQGYLFGAPMAIDDIKALFFPEQALDQISGK